MAPKISVITVVLNNRDGFRKTMESVISQTYRNFEIVVVDGGSTDGTVDVIREFEPHIQKWVSEKDRGIYHAMNKGIGFARGEYLMFLNSGDYLLDAEVFRDVFEEYKGNADVIYGDAYYETADGKLIEKRCPAEITFEFLIEEGICHQASFIRADLFERYGLYDETLRIASDHKFFLKTLLVGSASSHHVDRMICNYNLRGVSSVNLALSHQECKAAEKELFSLPLQRLYDDYKVLKKRRDSFLPRRIVRRLRREWRQVINRSSSVGLGS